MRQRSVRITMSLRELDRLKCIQAVIDGELPAPEQQASRGRTRESGDRDSAGALRGFRPNAGDREARRAPARGRYSYGTYTPTNAGSASKFDAILSGSTPRRSVGVLSRFIHIVG